MRAANSGGGEERRVVTTLFCDLVGFTSLSERNDPELVDAFLRRYYAVARRSSSPTAAPSRSSSATPWSPSSACPPLHEDDPERAVRAGLRLVDEVDALPGIGGQAVEVRVGVNTGEALVRLDVDPGSGEGFLTGDAVNVAARLQSAAPPMAVAVGEATHAATEQVFAFDACHAVTLKGKSQPLRAWIATAPWRAPAPSCAPSPRPSSAATRSSPPWGTARGGAAESHAALRPHRRRAGHRQEPAAGRVRSPPRRPPGARHLAPGPLPAVRFQRHLLGALGDRARHAGILESDGVARAEARLETVLPEGEDRDRLRARLRPLLGLEAEEASREENFSAWRHFFERQAAAGPTVLVVEDLHWADEAMLAFLDDLADNLAEVPLLVLATARPEVLEAPDRGRASWRPRLSSPSARSRARRRRNSPATASAPSRCPPTCRR